ncbi:homeobox protein knotted-1-like 3 isoform X1 [Cucurbita moschata]|uniref:Homeobox protein knotted-1-like 3 isoform X1 n=2 Tax=Cucurbita moschata TaxID=3662 RepID=A0A6J1FP69_CUCMO|nr:homeobox protein knotted-1-like 3 isoform X1 [Cucurbita moschata]XP_022940404.1 homeobox protein knotted-1-like 3 isoform X1 [Cucurbita moschata]
MAYHNPLSHDLPLHFSDQQPPQNQPLSDASLRTILPDPKSHHHHHHPPQTAPNWLNNALLRNQNPHSHYSTDTTTTATAAVNTNFLNLHTTASDSTVSHSSNQWLSRPILQRNHSDVIADVAAAGDAMIGAANDANSGDGLNKSEGMAVEPGGGGGGGGEGVLNWQYARYKAEILAHPLYEQLLSAHVACLRIATPVDQLPRIDAQLAQSQNVVAKYSALGHTAPLMVGDDKDLDQFMTHYVLLLCSFKEQLQQHVRVHAMEAVMACWDIEQSLQSLTGVSPGEGTGATMSDDDDDQVDSDANLFEASLDCPDTMGFGPLIPTETERSLMERVRQELKHELKAGYKEKIVDIREEILRKRRAGKLPGDTTSVLKQWWQSHSKWPYPTEEDKARLVQETGLQLKQINNWFINQRKRNWHSNPSSSTNLKSKRKRSNAGENSSDRFK